MIITIKSSEQPEGERLREIKSIIRDAMIMKDIKGEVEIQTKFETIKGEWDLKEWKQK